MTSVCPWPWADPLGAAGLPRTGHYPSEALPVPVCSALPLPRGTTAQPVQLPLQRCLETFSAKRPVVLT